MLKKIFYSFILFFVVLILAIVIGANSSFVIKKVADVFAPKYKISYTDITGNILTGVKITDLKFNNKDMIQNIKFSWNPSKILYKTVAINEISIDKLEVDVLKELIASFPESKKDDTPSAPLPVSVVLDKIHISINPFEEQGILITKTLLELKDTMYSNNGIEVEKFTAKIDTSVTNMELDASLDEGKLKVDNLALRDIDSVALEQLFFVKETKHTKKTVQVSQESTQATPLNPLIPIKVEVKHFITTLKPRNYQTASIDKLELILHEVDADVIKLMKNKKNALAIAKYTFDFKSNMGQLTINGDMQKDTITLNDVNLSKIDVLALQTLVTKLNKDSNHTEQKSVIEDKNIHHKKKQNNLIPKTLIVKKLHTDILPSTFEPVKILNMALNAKDIDFDIEKLMAKNGYIDLNIQTNLASLKEEGNINNNVFNGDIVLNPEKKLFELYKLPLRKEAINTIKIDFTASKEEVVAHLNTRAKQILLTATDTNSTKKAFNVDIDNLSSKVVYALKKNILYADTNIAVSTPYAKDISISNKFVMDGNISFSGAVKANKIIGIEEKFTKPVNHLDITYEGDMNQVKTLITSDGLSGSFVSSDLKKGMFHLQTKRAVEVGKMLTLPAEIKAAKVNAVIDVPVNLLNPLPIHGKAKVSSNVANVDFDFTYDKNAIVALKLNVPPKSLLRNFDKNIKWTAISPLTLKAQMDDKVIKVNVKSNKIFADLDIEPKIGMIDGTIKLAGLATTINAQKNGSMVIKSKVGSMKSLFTTVNQFYKMDEMPKVDGKLDISLVVDKKSNVALHLSSPKIVYHADRKTDHNIENIKIVLATKKTQVTLKSYQLTYNKMKIFATKPSMVDFQKENIHISKLWLNDQLQVEGNYNTKIKKGTILTNASKFHLAHEMIDLDSAIKIKTKLNGESTAITGKVTLLGGDVHYNLDTKSFPSDSDILIVQDMKKEKVSPFMDNLSTEIQVRTQKPIVYKQGPIDVKANINLGIHKDKHADLMLLGSVELPQGGSYIFQDKKFVLDKSYINFVGNPEKPLLEISIKYKSVNYLVTILVTGSPSAPNIAFSSVPSLSKEQILSVILFDSIESAGGGDAGDMMKMMGGMMAKSALADFGVKIDHLVVGAGGSVEVGKKVTEKITIIYVNDEISSVQLKYDHGKHTQSVLSTSQRSSSYDIIYKGDF